MPSLLHRSSTISGLVSSSGKRVSVEPLSHTLKPQDKIIVNNVQMTKEKIQEILEENQKNQSKSGQAPQKIKNYYLKDYNAEPGLAYVNITLSSLDHTFEEAKTHVFALHGSGCAKTIINQKVFESMQQHGPIKLKPLERPTVIITTTGEPQPVAGSADILLHFEGINQVRKSFELNVLVHAGITQDFLLGRDFSGSDARAFETNKFLFLTDNVTIIPLLSHGQVIGTIAKDPKKQYRLPLSTKELTTYVVKNGTQPGLQTLPWIMDYIRPNQVCVPVYNSTPYEMIIEKNMFVADIEIMQNLNEFEMHSMSMSEVPHDVIETNHATPAFVEPDVIEINHVRPSFIQDDEGMNEEEKEEAFLHYMKFGYHHPSMTKEVEEKAALTELTLLYDRPLSEEEFDTQFDVAHLLLKHRTWALQMFGRQRDALCKRSRNEN
jgi:hypothetical protein